MSSTKSLTEPHWSESLVSANGIRQHIWRTGGKKPAVVCLPGFSEIGLTWSRVARALEDKYDVIMVDFRGQGKTDVGSAEYSQDTLTADVAALLGALGISRAAVMGFSNGGGVAAQLAAEHPDLVRAVVLEDGGWGPKPNGKAMTESAQYRAWFDSYIAWLEGFQKLSTEEQRSSIVTRLPAPASSAWAQEEIDAWAESMAQYQIEFAKRGMSLWSTTDKPVRELIGSIRAPVLMMVALKGGMPGAPKPTEEIRQRVASLSNVKLVEVETSHFIRREMFDRFVAEVRGFLG
jgi:pimeloyl-ACP methyl ester carboxylesterase